MTNTEAMMILAFMPIRNDLESDAVGMAIDALKDQDIKWNGCTNCIHYEKDTELCKRCRQYYANLWEAK